MQKRSLVLRGWAFLQVNCLSDKTIPQQAIAIIVEFSFVYVPSREVCPEFKQQHVKDIGRIIAKEILDGVMSKPKEIDESIVR
uniref:Uncharacterized protein n=1 Tax=Ditylenchus dipsaci TaxID=166011 RepID=A0A915D0Y5_9BILA